MNSDSLLYPVRTWDDAVLTAITRLLTGISAILPNLLGAIIIILLGFLAGGIVKQLVRQLFRMVHLDTLADRVGFDEFLRRAGFGVTPIEAMAQCVRWFVIISFILAGLSVLGLPAVTEVLHDIVSYIPRVVAAVLILTGGLLLANFLEDLLRGTLKSMRLSMANSMAGIAKWMLVVFTVLAVIRQLEIVPDLVNILFTGIVGAIALAIGLMFGLGGKDVASRIMEEWYAGIKELGSNPRKK